MINSYSVPGVEPLTLGHKALILLLAILLALVLFGLLGLFLPPPYP